MNTQGNDVTPLPLSPSMSNLVTRSQIIRDSVNVNAVNALSPLPSELVTGPLNFGDSSMAAIEPHAKTSEVASDASPIALSVPFRLRVDDTDYSIVDYDEDVVDECGLGSVTPNPETPVPLPQCLQDHTHATLVVRDWNDYGISGLKIVRACEDLARHVQNVISHFFYPNNIPKPGLYWTDLFSSNVFPTKIFEVESGETIFKYENSTRATVPLFDWIRGRTETNFEGFNMTENAVHDTLSFENFVLGSIMPSLGFNSDLVSFHISGMSILIQPPIGGISQAIHTDDYPECPPGEWISIIFPCHEQRSTVFLSNDKNNAFGKATGVKPFLNIGDLAAWSKVRHFGSGAEDVDVSLYLRCAIFVFVRVKPLHDLIPKGMPPVAGEFSEGNRDEKGEEIIQYGPDVIHWTGGLVPIIRVCVSCLYGVNYDYEAQRPSDVPEEAKEDPFSTNLLFCTECVQKHQVRGCEARVQSLICQWCKDMNAFYPVAKYPDLDDSNSSGCVIDCIYQGVLDAQLCTHGKSHYQRLPEQDALFVLFSHQEIAKSCQFWLDFFKTYKFTTVYAPTELSHTLPHWSVFWEVFMSNSSCTRARMLCMIGAMVAGIGPVLSKKGKKVYHGGYPVFFQSELWNRECGVNAFAKMISACEDGTRLVFNEAHLLKLTRRVLSRVEQTYWEYSMRCQCNVTHVQEVDVDDGEVNHRIITFCSGPRLRPNVPQSPTHVSQSDTDMSESFMLRCTQLWMNGRTINGG